MQKKRFLKLWIILILATHSALLSPFVSADLLQWHTSNIQLLRGFNYEIGEKKTQHYHAGTCQWLALW